LRSSIFVTAQNISQPAQRAVMLLGPYKLTSDLQRHCTCCKCDELRIYVKNMAVKTVLDELRKQNQT
jgi:hypothetical protein